MPVLDRALWFNGLVDDDGSGLVGTIWSKAEVGKFMDTIDDALGEPFPAAAHAATHRSGGSDAIKLDDLAAPIDVVTLNATTTAHGLLPKLAGGTSTFLRADGTWAAPTLTAHAATHKSGGSDALKLDELAAPTDVTALNASTTAHGLLPKLPGSTTTFLRGDGTFALPPGGTPSPHAASHAAGGTDPVTITTLAGFPGDTTTFLRADGQFVLPPSGGGGGGSVNGPATSVVGRVATWNDATGTLLADGGVAAAALVLTTDPRLTDARAPTAHKDSHQAGGTDAMPIDSLAAATDTTALNASTTAHGLLPKLPGTTTTFLRGDGAFAVPPGSVTGPGTTVIGRVATWNNATGTLLADDGVLLSSLVLTDDPRLSDARAPSSHATAHKSGGADAIKIDELAAPTDVTTLNVSTAAHGLAPKLPGTTTTFLRGDGVYAVPAGGSGGVASYPATLTDVVNTTTPTVFASFTVPALGDRDSVSLTVAALMTNNSGGGCDFSASAAYAGVGVTLGHGAIGTGTTNGRTLFQVILQRVGADIWVFVSTSPITRYDDALTLIFQPPKITPGVDFSTPQTLALRMTLNVAATTATFRPQAVTCLHIKAA